MKPNNRTPLPLQPPHTASGATAPPPRLENTHATVKVNSSTEEDTLLPYVSDQPFPHHVYYPNPDKLTFSGCREPEARGKVRNPMPNFRFQSAPQSRFHSGLIYFPSTASYTYRNALRDPRPHQRLHAHGLIFSLSMMVMKEILKLLNTRQTHHPRLGPRPQWRGRKPHNHIRLTGPDRYPAICVESQAFFRGPNFGIAKNYSNV